MFALRDTVNISIRLRKKVEKITRHLIFELFVFIQLLSCNQTTSITLNKRQQYHVKINTKYPLQTACAILRLRPKQID